MDVIDHDTATTQSSTDSGAWTPPPPFPVERIRELGREITQLSANINAATYQLLVLIAEFDQIKGWSDTGSNSCAHWLNWRCGICRRSVRPSPMANSAIPRRARLPGSAILTTKSIC